MTYNILYYYSKLYYIILYYIILYYIILYYIILYLIGVIRIFLEHLQKECKCNHLMLDQVLLGIQ